MKNYLLKKATVLRNNPKILGRSTFWMLVFVVILTAASTSLFGHSVYAANQDDQMGAPGNWWNPGWWIPNVSWLIFRAAAGIAWLGGYLLDQSIRFTMDKKNMALGSIQIAWTMVRDVSNVFFIFILLYIAIKTILNANTSETKKLLVNLIIAALLINFSLFFTEVIIDATNIMAVALYNWIIAPALDNPNTAQTPISSYFMSGLNLSSLFNGIQINNMSTLQIIWAYGLGSIVVIIAGLTFFAGALMFVFRTISLMFIMILSPFAFLAFAFPGMQGEASKWWSWLIGEAVFAPAYMLMLLLTIRVIQTNQAFVSVQNQTGGTSAFSGAAQALGGAQVGPNASGYLGIFMTYMIILGLTVGSLIVAKRLGGMSAALGIQYGGRAVGATFGAAAFAGRQSVGRGLNALSKNKRLDDMKGSDNRFVRTFARTTQFGATKAAQSSFDARKAGVGTGLNKILGAGGISTDFGKAGGDGGYRKFIDTRRDARVKTGQLLSGKAQKHYVDDLKRGGAWRVVMTNAPRADKEAVAKLEAYSGIKKGRDELNTKLSILRQQQKSITRQQKEAADLKNASLRAGGPARTPYNYTGPALFGTPPTPVSLPWEDVATRAEADANAIEDAMENLKTEFEREQEVLKKKSAIS